MHAQIRSRFIGSIEGYVCFYITML